MCLQPYLLCQLLLSLSYSRCPMLCNSCLCERVCNSCHREGGGQRSPGGGGPSPFLALPLPLLLKMTLDGYSPPPPRQMTLYKMGGGSVPVQGRTGNLLRSNPSAHALAQPQQYRSPLRLRTGARPCLDWDPPCCVIILPCPLISTRFSKGVLNQPPATRTFHILLAMLRRPLCHL
jgi:hypothetical protein